MEKSITSSMRNYTKISQNIKKDKKRVKDDSCSCMSSSSRRVIKGIDHPLLNGRNSFNPAMEKPKRQMLEVILEGSRECYWFYVF